ncbi:MAG: ABC transporter ATP-binding protein [Spirochaetia bacterium]|jgi:simple sugar transport system ATP-binding protein|nr:ABC transporter ATP-binding protein [Spirochaetia bacterium]
MAEYLELKDITKKFGSVVANDHVSVSFSRGEIHALLGENGSGKSTLMNILSGIYAADSGQILLEGKALDISCPKDALKHGIGMIHQHFKLVDVFSALDNIIAGHPTGFYLDRQHQFAAIRQLCDQYGFKVDLKKKIYEMSVSERQKVEIIKVLYFGARILILDEPTAVLTPQETEILFNVLREMKKQGCVVILITHKFNEVMSVSDRITVLRKGLMVGSVRTDRTDSNELTRMMVGHEIALDIPTVPSYDGCRTVMRLKDVTVEGHAHLKLLDAVNLELKSNQILGIAGIAGSGQEALCEAIAGLLPLTGGSIEAEGFQQIGFVPEDRLGMGLLASASVVDNVLLRSYRKGKYFFVDRTAGKKQAEELVRKYNVSTPSIYQKVSRLSGGNIQKILLGREIDCKPSVLLVAYPVRGLDIQASNFIYEQLNAQKEKGVSIVFVGEDLDVLLALCDRIAVMHEGRIAGIYKKDTISKQEVGLLMMGERLGEKHDQNN